MVFLCEHMVYCVLSICLSGGRLSHDSESISLGVESAAHDVFILMDIM